MKNIIKVFAVFLFGCLPPQVFALTKSSSVMNQASVTAVCMVSVDNLQFGEYNPVNGTEKTANTNVYVTCVNGAPYNVYLNAGLHSDSNILNRKMLGTGTGKLLSYQLYGSASVSGDVWGDGSSGTDFQCGVGNGTQDQLTVYGKIPAGQTTASVDSYTDVITVSVSY